MPDKQKVKKYSLVYINKKSMYHMGFRLSGGAVILPQSLNLKSKILTKITAITKSEVYQKDEKPPKTGGFSLYQQLS